MSIEQRYISEELTHFVGRGKAEEEQYDLLVNKIIKPGLLMHPPHDLKHKSGWEVKFDAQPSKNEFLIPTMICFCDIPISDFSIHMSKYSRFALSFRKQFLIDKGANPVHYIAMNSQMQCLSSRMTRAKYYDENLGNIMRSLMMIGEAMVPKNQVGTATESLSSHNAPGYMAMNFINFFLMGEVFAYIKFFDDSKSDDDPENYYMEREWRMTDHVEFHIADVHRIIIPESYAARFRKDVPDFNGQLTFAG